MHVEQKKRFVKEIALDLGVLTGLTFERFCYALIERLAPAVWTHKGTNLTGESVGSTVDSKAYGGRWVAEYSSEKTYFATSSTKLEDDITHARSLHPQVERLWTISSQKASPSASTASAQLATRELQRGLELNVLDARMVAEFIVDNIVDDSLIEGLKGYLSTLERIRNEWGASHRIPRFQDYVRRTKLEEEALRRLTTEQSIVLTGIGGSGKSALCSALADALLPKFELVLWIDADSIRHPEDLYAIDVLRNGARLNVVGFMRTRPCLVVLDNANGGFDFQSLLQGAHTETRVIATTQNGPASALLVGELEPEEARKVLDPNSDCPSETFKTILSTIGGHALMLGLLGDVAREEGWGSVLALLSDATGLEDSHGRVCERILGRHKTTLDLAFRLVAVTGARVDEELWDFVAGIPARRSFRQRHFLTAASTKMVRVHDIVTASIKQLYRAEDPTIILTAIASFIDTQMGKSQAMTLQRVARHHHGLFEALLRKGERRAAYRYAYALSRHPVTDLTLLGDPILLASEITASDASIGTSTRAVIECIECSFTIISTRTGKKDAKHALGTMLPALDHLLALANLPVTVRRDLVHHRGKALDRLDRLDEAAEAFKQVLRENPEFLAARLQYGRVLARLPNKADEALEQLEVIFRFAEKHPDERKLAIVLSAFETLGLRSLKSTLLTTVTAHQALLLSSLRQALQFGHDHPYRTIAQLGLTLSYEAPELFFEVFSLIPQGLSTPETDEERFAWAQALKQAAIALQAQSDARAPSFFADAVAVYSEIQRPTEFMLVQAAEATHLAGLTDETSRYLERVELQSRGEHWHHRMAQSLLLSDPTRALDHIDVALSLIVQESRFRSTFLQQRYQIRSALRHADAIEDLNTAIAECNNPKHKAELEQIARSALSASTGD